MNYMCVTVTTRRYFYNCSFLADPSFQMFVKAYVSLCAEGHQLSSLKVSVFGNFFRVDRTRFLFGSLFNVSQCHWIYCKIVANSILDLTCFKL